MNNGPTLNHYYTLTREEADNRKILNIILWTNRTGAPWRDLLEQYDRLYQTN
jgi:transposase